jgi:hypothetical protein
MGPALDHMADDLSERTFIDSIVGIDRGNDGDDHSVQIPIPHSSSRFAAF